MLVQMDTVATEHVVTGTRIDEIVWMCTCINTCTQEGH